MIVPVPQGALTGSGRAAGWIRHAASVTCGGPTYAGGGRMTREPGGRLSRLGVVGEALGWERSASTRQVPISRQNSLHDGVADRGGASGRTGEDRSKRSRESPRPDHSKRAGHGGSCGRAPNNPGTNRGYPTVILDKASSDAPQFAGHRCSSGARRTRTICQIADYAVDSLRQIADPPADERPLVYLAVGRMGSKRSRRLAGDGRHRPGRVINLGRPARPRRADESDARPGHQLGSGNPHRPATKLYDALLHSTAWRG